MALLLLPWGKGVHIAMTAWWAHLAIDVLTRALAVSGAWLAWTRAARSWGRCDGDEVPGA